jgi:Zinc finger, C3HC4 type (RING finger)
LIRTAQNELRQKKISSTEFLNRLTFGQSSIFRKDNFDDVAEYSDSDESSVEDVQEEPVGGPICRICLERPPNMVLRPCSHLSTCKICWEELGQNFVSTSHRQFPPCPICRTSVNEAILIFS